ncbi:uncharacterized protein VTP21DRAFT_7177 [Calcarisporiella thermophila]|uniref:uncharacterized protein n=1 Tax=Calcarisporiella thermophila TaxID=911321 RepID=UPI00374411E1
MFRFGRIHIRSASNSLRYKTVCESRPAALPIINSAARAFNPMSRSLSSSNISYTKLYRTILQPTLYDRSRVRSYSSKSFPPHQTILMPALSPTMTAGNIGVWQKKVGDAINPGDVLVEIETDKAQMDFECQEEGFLAKILVDSGAKEVSINTPIAVLVENEEDVSKFTEFTAEDAGGAPKKEESKPEPKPEPKKEPKQEPKKEEPKQALQKEDVKAEDRVFASPYARKLANERGITIDQIKGTGPNGRIVAADVEGFVPEKAATAKPSATEFIPSAPAGIAYTDIPLSNMRKIIASRLTESKQTIPHYYLTVDVEMDKVLKLREVLNNQADGKFKLSVNDFIVKASALALRDVPEANSSWQGDFIRQYHNSDICVAVATPNGLITPIVPSCETKGLSTISNLTKELAQRARDGKLKPQEFQGGSFTISNLGMYGIKQFAAVINPPQSCILAVGTTEQKVVPDASKDSHRVANVMTVTLSCDHRVVDGAVGARFLQTWKQYIENPLKMML